MRLTPNLPYYGALVSGDFDRARYIAAGMGGDHLDAVLDVISGGVPLSAATQGDADHLPEPDESKHAAERATSHPGVTFEQSEPAPK